MQSIVTGEWEKKYCASLTLRECPCESGEKDTIVAMHSSLFITPMGNPSQMAIHGQSIMTVETPIEADISDRPAMSGNISSNQSSSSCSLPWAWHSSSSLLVREHRCPSSRRTNLMYTPHTDDAHDQPIYPFFVATYALYSSMEQ